MDWLVDVNEHFELQFFTLHLSISLLDRYLQQQREPQPKTNLQLIGTACIKIADQLCERSKEYYR